MNLNKIMYCNKKVHLNNLQCIIILQQKIFKINHLILQLFYRLNLKKFKN